MIGLVLIFFGPFVLLFSGLTLWLLKRFQLIPSGVSGFAAFGLISSIGLGGVLLAITLDTLILQPHRLQDDLLEGQFGSPASLRNYEFWGFQDQGWEWRYALAEDDVTTLKRRCQRYPEPGPRPSSGCSVGDASTPYMSRYADLTGNILTLHEQTVP